MNYLEKLNFDVDQMQAIFYEFECLSSKNSSQKNIFFQILIKKQSKIKS